MLFFWSVVLILIGAQFKTNDVFILLTLPLLSMHYLIGYKHLKKNMNKVLILDTHPTSYRSNLYKYLGEDLNENLLICYLSGYSLNTHIDIDFNSKINDTNVVTDNYKLRFFQKIGNPKK